MKLAIIGSRSFTDYALFDRTIKEQFGFCMATLLGTGAPPQYQYRFREIVSGGAEGADSLAKRWADYHQIPITELKPEWDKHGGAAPLIRNGDIVAASDMVLAFWNGHLKSGTRNALNHAKRLKRPTLIVYF